MRMYDTFMSKNLPTIKSKILEKVFLQKPNIKMFQRLKILMDLLDIFDILTVKIVHVFRSINHFCV